jgi:hypothetical protein
MDLRPVFIRVYRLEIQSVMLVFSTQLCEMLLLSPFFLVQLSPLPCVNKYTAYINVYSVYGGEGVGVWASER